MITAFTIGHSLSLIVGASQWLKLPTQPIEVLIALSILITAMHTIKPIFPNHESYVALGFGIIHGLAFAEALTSLHLDTTLMALSILGFNIGIELMQLVVVMAALPWILLLANSSAYSIVRIVLATIFAMASFTWLLERITSESNFLSPLVNDIATHGKYFLLFLILLALGVKLYDLKKNKFTTD
jgi:hypothetical protein